MTDDQKKLLSQEIQRLRSIGVPAKSGRLADLFDYLGKRSLEDDPPKEIEIAADVFERQAVPDDGDSSVRVYVHRLRKKLEDHYLRNPGPEGQSIRVPLGEYRLVLGDAELADTSAEIGDAPAPPSDTSQLKWVAVTAIALLLFLNVIGWGLYALNASGKAASPLNLPVWSSLKASDTPLTIVLGDYYIFGEFEDGLFLKRLIRDFDVNTRDDLEARIEAQPELEGVYGDVALEYLPVSTGYSLSALHDVLEEKSPRIIQASQLTPEDLKCCDLLYIGLTSGLGSLEELVLRQGRFQAGKTYDEIVDTDAEKTYTSEAFLAAGSNVTYRDYAVFSILPGPSGNTIWVLAGTRDTGLVGLSEVLTEASSQINQKPRAVGQEGYSALYEIAGQKHLNLRSRLVADTLE